MNVCPQRAVRDERFKLVLNLHPERKWTTHFTKVMDIPGSHGDVYSTWTAKAREDAEAAHIVNLIERHPKWELYDTKSDPFELTNLIDHGGHAKRLGKLRMELRNWLKSQGDQDAQTVAGE
jgi:N-sulfoglucosamine sulfohydrolase